LSLPFCGTGVLINFGEFDGLTREEAKKKITQKAEQLGFAIEP
jgi:valyl-tRNA synthetase